ncbi:hypothetical protein [Psychroserpens sp. MEBiC05023]
MNENADKHLDNLSRKVIGKSSIDSPSFDFTHTVMSQIYALNTSVTTYKPLISKRVWFVIMVAVVSVFSYVIFGNSSTDIKWLRDLNMQGVSLDVFPDFKPSQTLVYAVLLFAIMLCIQIPLLKRYFDKRIES